METRAEDQLEIKAKPAHMVKWTVMIYFAVGDDLDHEAIANLKAIKKVGSTDRIKILAQLDSRVYGSAYRFLIQDERTMFEEDIKAELPDINTGDPRQLTDFLKWGMKEYPAQHYLAVLWGHGRGWDNLGASKRASDRDSNPSLHLSESESPNFHEESSVSNNRERELLPTAHSRNMLMLDELASALRRTLESGDVDKIDLFGMDACLMGMAEVGYQIRDNVRYLVASEDAIPKDGWPYERIFTRLKDKPGMTPEQLSVTIIRELLIRYRELNREITLSVCDLGQSGRLVNALKDLANALKERLYDLSVRNAILTARVKAQSFYIRDYVDLYDFCSYLDKYCNNQVVVQKCQATMDVIRSGANDKDAPRTTQISPSNNSFVFEFGFSGYNSRGANGISIYFPVAELSPKYANLQFAKDSGWGEFLIELTTPVEEVIKQKNEDVRAKEMEDVKMENSNNMLVSDIKTGSGTPQKSGAGTPEKTGSGTPEKSLVGTPLRIPALPGDEITDHSAYKVIESKLSALDESCESNEIESNDNLISSS